MNLGRYSEVTSVPAFDKSEFAQTNTDEAEIEEKVQRKAVELLTAFPEEAENELLIQYLRLQLIMEEYLAQANPKGYTDEKGRIINMNNRDLYVKLSDKTEERHNKIFSPYSFDAITQQKAAKFVTGYGSLSGFLERNYRITLLSQLERDIPEAAVYDTRLRKGLLELDKDDYLTFVEHVRQRRYEAQHDEFKKRWSNKSLIEIILTKRAGEETIEDIVASAFSSDEATEEDLYIILLAFLRENIDFLVSEKPYNKNLYPLKEAVIQRMVQTNFIQRLKQKLSERENYESMNKLSLACTAMGKCIMGDFSMLAEDSADKMIFLFTSVAYIDPSDTETIIELIAQRAKIEGHSQYQKLQERNMATAASYLHSSIDKTGKLSFYAFKRSHRELMADIGGGGNFKIADIAGNSFERGMNATKTPYTYERGRALVDEFNGTLARCTSESVETETVYEEVAKYICDYNKYHIFPDGTGRHAHILGNEILRQSGLPEFHVPRENFLDYFVAVNTGIEDQSHEKLISLMKDHAVVNTD